MRLYLLPEIVGTEQRVSEVVRQRIPGHRTGDGEHVPDGRACCDDVIYAAYALYAVAYSAYMQAGIGVIAGNTV